MKLPDTNVWLALAIHKHSHHAAARAWFDAQTAAASVAFCRATHQSLLRLLSAESLMRLYGLPPLTNRDCWQFVQDLRKDPRITFAVEHRRVETQWHAFATRRTASPKLWMDAYLAAFALAGDFQLVTTDGAFTQFPGLDVHVIASP